MLAQLLLKKRCLLGLAVGGFLMLTLAASAQSNNSAQSNPQITGRVTDSAGTSLGGVTVGVKGSKRGATTDSTGYFTLSAPGNAVLTFSMVGFRDQQVALNGRTSVTVALLGGRKDLGDVVVIGYGTRKKVNLTGAVSDISGGEIAKSPVANISNALAGSMPGLIVNTRSGEPGADDATFYIRGIGTLGNTAPLIVIDGVPDRQGGFNRLDPNDIESFTVLKDATGAIYGARAANGVVLITTKRGISGKPILSFTSNNAWTQPTRVPKMLNSHDYAESVNEYDALVGQQPTYTAAQLQKYADGSDPLGYPNTNWWKTVMNTWAYQNNDVISLRGGSDKVRYYLSGQYLRQNSMYKGGSDYYTNKNVRANIDIQATPSFRMGLDAMYRNEYKLTEGPQYGSAGDIFQELWSAYPYLVARYPDGKVGVGIGGGPQNSMVYVLNGDLGNTTNNYDFLQTKTSFGWNWDKITPGLHLDGYYSYDLFYYNYKGFNAQPPPAYSYDETTNTYTEVQSSIPPNLSITDSKTEDQLVNLKLGYERKFGKSAVEAFAAYEMSRETYTELDAYRTGFLSNSVQDLFAGSTIGQTNNSVTTMTARQNYIGRVSYNYDDRYLVDVNMREDGSPNFPQGKQYGFFPAVSAAWRVSNESFFKSGVIDELKVRGSWGQTGNDAVNPYQYIQTYQLQAGQVSQYLAAGYFYGATPTQVPGFVLGPTPNVNITWETATTTDLGLDMRLIKNLTFDMDVFRSMRTHILVPPNETVPQYTGLTLPDENLGKVLNHGIEFQLGWHKSQSREFSYFVNGNFTFAVNKVVYEAEPASVPAYQRLTGHPTGSFLLYQAMGLYQDTATVSHTPHPLGSGPGDIRYKDVNGDGVINALDEVRTNRSATPEIMYGLNFGGRYRNFDVSIFFQGQAAAKAMLQPGGLNMAQQFYDGRWLKPGDDKYPRTFNGPTNATYGSNTYASTFWLLNDAFLRMKNVEIGYNLPRNGLLSKAKIASARFYVSGNNLFSIDKWGPSFDPEAPSGSSTNGRYYPQQRVLNVGLNVTF
ncbi:SusC/RagA family TonB-linked outer membrane protein [Dinghuibacter silviterrae]|uniref:TonB-linked SusC/RagA family outer membrane protein n=1 Tax=Dinghuibacter silviterrae TaxID=1539049 RepID=A0A4R8DGA1_9BACT|nr:TonB-dependent receptor [Dinghuibacter silviterrae]TDW96671.1 TonB-linked SusC/RagA family outer membrane protein [Dinghuibacter silviterrae]